MIDGRWIEDHQQQQLLGEILVRMAIISERQLTTALGVSRQRGQLLGQTLVDLDLATKQQIHAALSQQRGIA